MAKKIRNMVVTELKNRFKGMDMCVVVNYTGVSSAEASELRSELRKEKVLMRVVKSSLAAIALKELGKAGVSETFKGQVAILHGGDDPVITAKKVVEVRSKQPKLALRGGYLNGRVLTDQEVIALSKMPDRKAMLGQVVGTLAAPMAGFVRTLNQITTKFVRVVAAVQEQKAKAGDGAPAATS